MEAGGDLIDVGRGGGEEPEGLLLAPEEKAEALEEGGVEAVVVPGPGAVANHLEGVGVEEEAERLAEGMGAEEAADAQ